MTFVPKVGDLYHYISRYGADYYLILKVYSSFDARKARRSGFIHVDIFSLTTNAISKEVSYHADDYTRWDLVSCAL